MQIRWSYVYFIIPFLVAAAALVILHGTHQPLVGVDDANIFFIYSRNLIHGHGLVYNIGGEPIEGFSSLLWVLLLAPCFLTAFPTTLVFLLNLVLVAVAYICLARCLNTYLTRRYGAQNPWMARVSVLLILTWSFSSPEFFSWSILSLMDVGLWHLLNVLLFVAIFNVVTHERFHPRSGVVLAILGVLFVLTRPEALLVVPVMLGALTAWTIRRQSLARAWAGLWPAWVGFLGAAALLTLFRLVYFGDPLPNTYYAKMSTDSWFNFRQGLSYMLQFCRWNPLVVPCFAAALIGALGWVRRLLPGTLAARRSDGEDLDALGFASLLPLVGLLLPLIEGGDHFESFRFYQPYWSLMIIPPVLGCLVLLSRRQRLGAILPLRLRRTCLAVAGVLPLLFNGKQNWAVALLGNGSPLIAHEFLMTQMGLESGHGMNWVADRVGRAPSVGCVLAGSLPFVYRGPVFDLMGLNHRAMAHTPGLRHGVTNHAAFNAEVFWRTPPEVMLPMLATPLVLEKSTALSHYPESFVFRVLKGLPGDERFRRDYLPQVIDYEEEGRIVLMAYFRRDFLEEMKRKGLPLHDLTPQPWN